MWCRSPSSSSVLKLLLENTAANVFGHNVTLATVNRTLVQTSRLENKALPWEQVVSEHLFN